MLTLSISVRKDAYVKLNNLLVNGLVGKLQSSYDKKFETEFTDAKGALWVELRVETEMPLLFVEGVYAMASAVITEVFMAEGEMPCFFANIAEGAFVVKEYLMFRFPDDFPVVC